MKALFRNLAASGQITVAKAPLFISAFEGWFVIIGWATSLTLAALGMWG